MSRFFERMNDMESSNEPVVSPEQGSEQARICPACQAPNPEGTEVCAFCGSDMSGAAAQSEQKDEPEAQAEKLPADTGTSPVENMSICPNCLEPNPDNLAVCPYCGQPLHPDADVPDSEMPEDAATLEANRQAALKAQQKDQKNSRQNGFRRIMPYLGLYLIFDAVWRIIETSRMGIPENTENPGNPVNPMLVYGSHVLFIIAGILMAWPLIKQWINKIRPGTFKVDEEEADKKPSEAETPAEESGAEPSDVETDEAETAAEDDGQKEE